MNRIVIIGGMGPQASLDLHKRIIDDAKKSGARRNEDFPEIIHSSIPVPDFISSGNSDAALRFIKESLASITLHKSDSVVLACNTAHLLIPELEALSGATFVSMIDTVADAVLASSLSKVGLVSSPTTARAELYKKALSKREVACLVPSEDDQERLEVIIRSVIADEVTVGDMAELQEITDRLADSGAQGIVLGCTEMPLIFSRIRTAIPIFDCLGLMSARLVGSSDTKGTIRYNKE